MTCRSGPIGVEILAVAALLGACGGEATVDSDDAGAGLPSASRPHVFLIVIDTARADHFSCYGYARETTPHIDRFARDAVLYENARSTAPWTLPAHASMFTGLPPGRHGLHWSSLDQRRRGASDEERQLPVVQQRERLLARVLKNAGYATIGITNNGWVGSDSGLEEGFDRFYEYYKLAKTMRTEQPGWPAEHRVPEELTDRDAGGSIALFKKIMDERADDAPVFAFFNFLEPHFPYLPGRAFRGCFDSDPEFRRTLRTGGGKLERTLLAGGATTDVDQLTRCYDETLHSVDAAVGHLFEWLRSEGLYDDALIVLTSDHGESLGEDDRYSHQLTVRRELLWIPLIVKYPGNEGAGRRVADTLVSVADVYPTILAAAVGEDGRGERQGERSWSRDLATLAPGERPWVLAESYYSTHYLDKLRDFNAAFDAEAHHVVRRVVFREGERYEFLDLEQVSGPPAPEDVVGALEDYAREAAALRPVFREGSEMDSETLQHLREFGYF